MEESRESPIGHINVFLTPLFVYDVPSQGSSHLQIQKLVLLREGVGQFPIGNLLLKRL